MLSTQELQKISGGSWIKIGGIVGGIVAFLSGFVEGFLRPSSCNK